VNSENLTDNKKDNLDVAYEFEGTHFIWDNKNSNYEQKEGRLRVI